MKSIVFVASSSESKHFADAMRKNLEDCAEVRVWDGSFELSSSIIDGLFTNLQQADFGIFILSADDAVRIKEKEYLGSRDNVIFELGLFMGRMGRERAFFLVPRNLPADKEFRLPSDLHGLVYPTFDLNETAQVATDAACQQIRRQIERLPGRHLYHVTNKNSGKCLDVEAWRRKPGARIVQWSYHGGANQLWRLERADDRFYYIRSEYSDLYLTAPGADDGPQVKQQDLRRTDEPQQWEFISLPGETYRITPRFDDELCLALESESTDNGASVVVTKWRHQAPYEWWLNIKATLDSSR